ncbi:30S ribosomal protein S1 [Thermosulfurimonas dismutans]|uniref:Small ribosomal subunit protein bS1 n=1 Tax=Thermosulfurimonas dismutans TaxID=999894 RepID=A0A179D1S6_9BACT|nr:30S ribosomal protein S1 [Thermosulfurimonas dismutans]OAQ19943.1 SSU ribosomal protein S1p [Thermosulfurimonas dismutans]
MEDIQSMESFEDFLNLESEPRVLRRGAVIEGTIIRINPDWTFVDIGYKSEGAVPTQELKRIDGSLRVNEGDRIEVLVERLRGEDGLVRLSYAKILENRAWEKILKSLKEKTPLSAYVVQPIKGGFEVEIEGVRGFLPFSHAYLKRPANPNEIVGKTVKVEVISASRKRNNVVVSSKNILEKEAEARKKALLEKLNEGDVVEGIVKNIVDYGAFIDIGGVEGFLHISDLSWGRIKHPGDLLKIGDQVRVKVLSLDREKERIKLGIKQLTPDPWESVAERYKEGDKVQGRVVSLTSFGAFVEVEPGVEGLIHLSELSWTKRIKHPRDMLSVGDQVETVVLKVDPENRKLSLSLRRIEPNPWEILVENMPPGTVIEALVKTVTDFGIFVEVTKEIDGFIHVSDLSWGRIGHPSEKFKPGDVIKAVVLKIDPEKEKLNLGIKQLSPDPWELAPEKYPVGSVVSGKVTKVTDFGIFVEIEEGLEGLVHVSELGEEKIKTPVGVIEVGQEVKAKVIRLEPEKKRMALSIRKYKEDEARQEYLHLSEERKGTGVTLGTFLKEVVNK